MDLGSRARVLGGGSLGSEVLGLPPPPLGCTCAQSQTTEADIFHVIFEISNIILIFSSSYIHGIFSFLTRILHFLQVMVLDNEALYDIW